MKPGVALLSLLLIAALAALAGCANQDGVQPELPVKSGFSTVSTGSTDDGDVLIEITPGQVRNGVLAADVLVNTHSVDLSQFDLARLSTLGYKGKSLNPVSAFAMSGHHSSGELVFDVGDDIKSFTIIIIGIPAVEERVFEWKTLNGNE